MHKSVDHILITHTGSLPRGQELNDLLIADEAGESVDPRKLADMVDKRVAYVMQKQREAGVDIANDGEQGRVGFQTYLPQRMSGFGGASKRPFGKEFIEYPQFTQRMLERIPRTGKVFDAPEAVADIKYRDTSAIDAEIARLKRLSADLKAPAVEYFMNAPSPGIIATTMLNAHYASHQAYLDAIARAGNDTSYGLSAYIWTSNVSIAHKLASRIKAGSISVNGGAGMDFTMPFGGFKQSGLGREHGREGVEAYTETKTVSITL